MTTFTSAAEAERHADKARADLAKTLDRLKGNLTPRRLAGEAVGAARARTPDWAVQAWTTACSPAGLSLIGLTAVGVVVALIRQRDR